LEYALQPTRRIGNGRLLATTLYIWGELRLRQGHLDDAEAAFAEVLHYGQVIGDLTYQVRAMYGLGRLRAAQGSHDHAAPLLDEAVSTAHQIGNRIFEAESLTALAQLHHTQADPDQAIAHINIAISICRFTPIPGSLANALQVHGHIMRTAGDTATAEASTNEAKTSTTKSVSPLNTNPGFPSEAGRTNPMSEIGPLPPEISAVIGANG
jgi:tetratricopeptide (TPR) repeat protein